MAKQPVPKTYKGLTQEAAQTQLAKGEASLERRIAGKSAAQQQKARNAFYSDPRIQGVRKAAGLPVVRTKKEEYRQIAQQNLGRREKMQEQSVLPELPGSDFIRSFVSSVGNTFGIAPRIAALPRSFQTGRSYEDELGIVRAEEELERNKSTAGNVLGLLYGGAKAGQAAASGVRAVGSRLASSSAPRAVQAAGRALQSSTKLTRGQTARNAAKIVAGGAAGGAAQAAGEGSDVGEGAAWGAGGAGALYGAGKAVEILSRPVRDVLRLSSLPGIMGRFTNTTKEELETLANDYRRATGAEPTVFELLPLNDRNAILANVVSPQDAAVEGATNAIRARASNLGPEMASRSRQIVQPQRGFVEQGIANDLVAARGGTPDPGDAALVSRAASSPTDMLDLRAQEARAIMAPFDNQQAYQNVEELLPQVPVNNNGSVTFQVTDPDVANLIRSSAGTLRVNPNGVTIRDVTDIIADLKDDVARGGIDGRAAQRAIDHLQGIVTRDFPDAADAMASMNDAYAARSRMAEGMREGAQTRLRDQVQVGVNAREARRIRNAYDSPEGAAGRALGQSNRIVDDLSGSPDEALRTTQDIARSGNTQRALEANIGATEASDLVRAAQAQEESARSLAAASRSAQAGAGGVEQMDMNALGQSLLALHPSTFATTRIWALRRLANLSYMPENRATQLVNMLFSQDPAQTRRAINLFNSSVRDGQAFLRDLGSIVATGGAAASAMAESPTEVPQPASFAAPVEEEVIVEEPDFTTMTDEELLQAIEAEENPDFSTMSDEELLQAIEQEQSVPYGRSVIEAMFPEAEITDDNRDPDSDLGRANPGSYHVRTDGAVDLRPIPGMTFNEFVEELKAGGYNVIEAIDETKKKNRSRHATGAHWHIVLG